MKTFNQKPKAPRNRTIRLSKEDIGRLERKLVRLSGPAAVADISNRTINQDLFEILDWLPNSFVDLLFLDPPYNLSKSFNGNKFQERSVEEYKDWMESWFPKLMKTLKPTASIYVCGDWKSSAGIHLLAQKHLIVRNRITWEREKGRGTSRNWKNCSEDIWFCTKSEKYTFNVEAVKLRRRVIAPYTDSEGNPKDWQKTPIGGFRLTHPSNIWTDVTVPFWSMPENTDHPTQKPEKLMAKIILASSNAGDLILDPFLGSGTTSVVAKKLGREYIGIELDRLYCLFAEKRLDRAEYNKAVQGYMDGVFWERNSVAEQRKASAVSDTQGSLPVSHELF